MNSPTQLQTEMQEETLCITGFRPGPLSDPLLSCPVLPWPTSLWLTASGMRGRNNSEKFPGRGIWYGLDRRKDVPETGSGTWPRAQKPPLLAFQALIPRVSDS